MERNVVFQRRDFRDFRLSQIIVDCGNRRTKKILPFIGCYQAFYIAIPMSENGTVFFEPLEIRLMHVGACAFVFQRDSWRPITL
jgi:hypothetical protein